MKKTFRLSKKDDFRVLFKRGRRLESLFFKAIVLPNNGHDHARFAFIAAKTVHKRAVVRNRLRRRTREWIRARSSLPEKPLDAAFIFKKEAVVASRQTFYEDLESLCRRIQ